MKVKFEYNWDWWLFATPCFEIGNMFGYQFIMFRCAWFWCAIEFRQTIN